MSERKTSGVIKTIMPCVERDRSDCHPQPPASGNRVCLRLTTSSINLNTRHDFYIIKHTVAHFAPLPAPFLLVLAIICFQDSKICWSFHIGKT